MKTEDLIAALAADNAPRRRSPAREVAVMTMGGALVSLAAFLSILGPRPDISEATATWRFDVKLAIVAAAAALAFAECLRLVRPMAKPSSRTAIMIMVPLAAAVGVELLVTPSDVWSAKQIGQNAAICLTAIPALALAPLIATIYAMRLGAPASPAAAGAMAGLSSVAIAATLYATHCIDDSPLFVATWYPLAALLVVGFGAFCGQRLLRW